MPYIGDENGNHVTYENGNKIEFTVNYEEIGYVCIHKDQYMLILMVNSILKTEILK